MKTVKSRLANKKGFTLVEIIVVLVIIAILAAAAVPTMIGYVEDARGKAFAAEARLGFVAAQAAIMEVLAAEGSLTDDATVNGGSDDCGVTYKIGTGSDSQLVKHPTFVKMTNGITTGAVFDDLDLDGSTNQISSLTFHSKALNSVPHYDIVVAKDAAITVTRVTTAQVAS